MVEKSTEEILDSWFFPAQVFKNGRVLSAPEEAIKKRDELKKDWLPMAPRDKNEIPEVILRPQYETPTGWKVETAIRTKPDTTSNKSPVKNN